MLTIFTLEMLECLPGKGRGGKSLSVTLSFFFFTLLSLTEHQIDWAQFLAATQVQSESLAVSDTTPSEHIKWEKISSVQWFPSLCWCYPNVVQDDLPYRDIQYFRSSPEHCSLECICPSKVLCGWWDSQPTQPSRNLVKLPMKEFVVHLERFSFVNLKGYL